MVEGGARRDRSRGRRIFHLSVVTVLPVTAVLVLAGIDALQPANQRRLPCPLYPNAVVAFAAEVHEGCPLEPGDKILGLHVDGRTVAIDSTSELAAELRTRPVATVVLRRVGEDSDRRINTETKILSDEVTWSQLAGSGLIATILLAFVLLTVIRADVSASVPFALIHSSVGVLIVAAVAGWTSTRAYPLTALARAVLPAAVSHLAFVFPRPREVALRVPRVPVAPYWVASVLFLLELNATYRGSASTMLLVQQILMAALVAAVSLLCLSSWLSIRESPSRLARRQARVFLSGVTLLLGATGGGLLAGIPGGSLTAITLGAALSPLPLGYAIARYQLFDFGTTVRRTVAHVLYLSIWSGLFFLGVVLLRDRLPIPEWLRNPMVMFAGVYAVLAPIDAMRHLLKRFIERAFQPGAKIWARLTEGRASQLAHLRDSDTIARTAVALAVDAAPGAGVSFFLGNSTTLRLSHARGAGACEQPDVASIALRLAGTAEVVDLNRLDTIEPEAARVYDAGVELISVVASDAMVHGVLLVCPIRRGRPHPAARMGWLRLVSIHAAAALENVKLAEQLRASEEFAVRGRMHAELAHEIGKPLGALEVLAQRLAAETGSSPGPHQRAASIARLAGQLRDIVRGVLEAGRSVDRVEVSDLIERASLECANVHGAGAVCVLPIPPLPTLDRRADRVVRALSNLIDNAIRASAPGEAVEIGARAVADAVEIEVVDRGCGIAPGDIERVFEAFVSMREGGNGLGLTISRQIVEQLGGTLVLESALGEGTRARLTLPTADAS
jgi:signal transduction histidine kinase